MRLVSLVEVTEISELTHYASSHNFELLILKSISEFERFELNNATDIVLMVVKTISASHLQFVERLMTFAPAPLIVTATNAAEWQLSALLQCGRVTFVPQQFDFSRLVKVVELAQIRFESANRLHSKLVALEHSLEDDKRVQLAKRELQQSGLSEQAAHRIIQQAAMDRRISLPDSAASLCKNQLRQFAHK